MPVDIGKAHSPVMKFLSSTLGPKRWRCMPRYWKHVHKHQARMFRLIISTGINFGIYAMHEGGHMFNDKWQSTSDAPSFDTNQACTNTWAQTQLSLINLFVRYLRTLCPMFHDWQPKLSQRTNSVHGLRWSGRTLPLHSFAGQQVCGECLGWGEGS